MSDNLEHHSHNYTLRNLGAMSAGASVVSPALAEAQADFALNLLRNTDALGSSIISPISISIALAMVYLGAKEETASQIRNAIAKNATEEAVHAHFGAILDLIDSNSLNVTLESANKVYVQKDFQLLQSYIDGIKSHYKGQLESVDFSEKEATAKQINAFVEQATHDRIKDLIKPDSLDALTRLILVNAIYFKGTWDEQFSEHRTVEADFYSSPNSTTKVQMMSIEEKFPYYETDDYQVLGLPYTRNKVAMYIILPRERYGLDDLISKLNAQTLVQLLSKRGRDKVNVKLPKFKIESELKLKDTLQKIGITEAFDNGAADLSGITGSKGLSVSDVIHKAFIETDEKGSVAAAVTQVQYEYRAGKIDIFPDPEFIADHSFLFVVSETETSTILFAGKVDEHGSEAAAVTFGKFKAVSAYYGKPKLFVADHPFLYALVSQDSINVLFAGKVKL